MAGLANRLFDGLLLCAELFRGKGFGFDDPSYARHALFGLNNNIAALRTIGLQGASVLDFVFGTQADLAVLPDHRRGGLDGAAVFDEAAVEADFLSDQGAKVDGFLFAVGNLDLDGGLVWVGNGDTFTRR